MYFISNLATKIQKYQCLIETYLFRVQDTLFPSPPTDRPILFHFFGITCGTLYVSIQIFDMIRKILNLLGRFPDHSNKFVTNVCSYLKQQLKQNLISKWRLIKNLPSYPDQVFVLYSDEDSIARCYASYQGHQSRLVNFFPTSSGDRLCGQLRKLPHLQ